MSRLKIATPDQAQLTVERLYKDLERHIIASPPGLCPVDLQLSFLKVCHAQTCGKCVPCRVGLAQLQNLMEDVLDGKATMETLDLIQSTAENVANSADCAIGFEAAKMVLAGLEGFREDYINHIKKGKCSVHLHQSIPCVALCPAQVDIPGYIALVGEGRYADAVKLIRKDNPFPTACGLICEHPCESRCRRNMIDAAINIRGLKRMAVDNAPSNTVPVPEKEKSTGKRVAIIGGGPSGLSAAYYLELMGHHAVVFEEKSKLGGMLRYGIPAYRFPRERLQEDLDAILSTGVEVHLNSRIGNGEGEIPFDKLREEFDAVYIAIGAHTDKKIGIPGEDSQGVVSAVEMLREIGEERMPDFKDKTVVVIGGGDTGNDCVGTCIRHGCKSVTQLEMMPKAPDERAESNPWPQWPLVCKTDYGQEEAIAVFGHDPRIYTTTVKEFVKDKKGNLSKLITVSLESKVDEKTGRRMMVPVDGTEKEIPCELVLIAAGFLGTQKYVTDAFGVELNERTNIKTDADSHATSVNGIFTAGDCHTGQSLVVKAIRQGRDCARAVDQYLMGYTNL